MIATPYTSLGTKITDLHVVNRAPVVAGSLTAVTTPALVVPTAAGWPADNQWPQSAPDSGQLVFKAAPANKRVFSFVHWHATTPAASTSSIRLWGLRKVICDEARPATAVGDGHAGLFEVWKVPLLDLTLIAGSNAVPVGSKMFEKAGGSMTWVDGAGITIAADYTRANSAIVYHEAVNNAGSVEIDSEGFERYLVEISPGSGVGVIVCRYDL